jgi:hypothetical protein
MTVLDDTRATLDILAAGHIGTVYIGPLMPSEAAMARDLDAHRAVLTVTGGCPSRDALFSEHREARR